MLATLTIRLRDAPGALLEALKPIAAHRGNVVSIVHLREQAKDELVPTAISFRFSDNEHLKMIVAGLEKLGRVMEVKTDGTVIEKKRSFSVLFYGHVMRTDAKNTMDRLGEAGALVSSFSLDIKERALPSCAILRLDVEEKSYRSVLAEIEKISKDKDLLAIRE